MTNRDIIIAVVSTLVVCLFGPYVSNSLGSQVTAVLELFKVNESDIRVINSIITTFLVVVTISVVICIGLYFKYWKKEAETIVMQCYSSRTPQLNSTPIHRNPQVNHVQHERIGKTTKEPEIFTGKEPEFWFKRFRLYVENNGIAPHKQLSTLLSFMDNNAMSLVENSVSQNTYDLDQLESQFITLFDDKCQTFTDKQAAFYNRKQLVHEGITTYHSELIKLCKSAWGCYTATEVLEDAVKGVFLDGLFDEQVKRAVKLSQPNNLFEAVGEARRVNQLINNSQNMSSQKAVFSSTQSSTSYPSYPKNSSLNQPNPVSYSRSYEDTRKCNYCGTMGHIERACKQKSADDDRIQLQQLSQTQQTPVMNRNNNSLGSSMNGSYVSSSSSSSPNMNTSILNQTPQPPVSNYNYSSNQNSSVPQNQNNSYQSLFQSTQQPRI